MRVIAGEKRHLLLKSVPGDRVRPTTDITKETLFNILNPYIPGCSFLDLFSGTGAIGIEAMSRGAAETVFVDNSKESLSCIKDNLTSTGLMDRARVIGRDSLTALSLLEGEGKCFDIIFMDPPYDNELEKQVLTRLSESKLSGPDTVIVVEASKKTDMSYISELGFTCFKEKDYKNNKHVFLKRTE